MIQITNEDNMQLMSRYKDNYFDLAIVDPPYGIGFDGHDTITKDGHKGFKRSTKLYTKKDWDKNTPDKEYFNELFRVSKNQIVFGGNYFTDKLPVSRGWIFWDKKITNAKNFTFSDGELAWTSFDMILKKITYDWIGFGYLNNSRKQKKIHPTEKPIDLYRKILKEYAEKGMKILDTHLGSGSIAIACYEEKFDLTACEIDKQYFEDANKRLKIAQMQTSMF